MGVSTIHSTIIMHVPTIHWEVTIIIKQFVYLMLDRYLLCSR